MIVSLRTSEIDGGCVGAGEGIGNSGCSGSGTTVRCARSVSSTGSDGDSGGGGGASITGGTSRPGASSMFAMRRSTNATSSASFAAFKARMRASSSHCAVTISSCSARNCCLIVSEVCGAAGVATKDCNRPIAASSCSVSALRLRRAYAARKARPRALADSASQNA